MWPAGRVGVSVRSSTTRPASRSGHVQIPSHGPISWNAPTSKDHRHKRKSRSPLIDRSGTRDLRQRTLDGSARSEGSCPRGVRLRTGRTVMMFRRLQTRTPRVSNPTFTERAA
jgi:hypothetical protein